MLLTMQHWERQKFEFISAYSAKNMITLLTTTDSKHSLDKQTEYKLLLIYFYIVSQ